MNTTPDPREEKLSRWARELIANLRREIQALERRLANEPGTDDVAVWADYYRKHPRPVASRDEPLTFQLDENEYFQVTLYEDGTLSIMYSGRGLFVVRPWVSNVIHVKALPRQKQSS